VPIVVDATRPKSCGALEGKENWFKFAFAFKAKGSVLLRGGFGQAMLRSLEVQAKGRTSSSVGCLRRFILEKLV
jgi:hypothetical protein